MKKFKIVYGYGEDDYITISGNELHKAIALFMEKNGRAVFENGAIRGQDIMRIEPDWHAVKNWNKSWKMTPDDYEDIKPLEADYRETRKKAEDIAKFAINNNQRFLLSIPATEAYSKIPQIKQTEENKLLTDVFNVKNTQ